MLNKLNHLVSPTAFEFGRARIRNRVVSKPTYVNTFETIGSSGTDKWIVVSSKGTQTIATTHYKAGLGSDRVVGALNQATQAITILCTPSVAFDASNSLIKFRYFVEDASGINYDRNSQRGVLLRLFNDAGGTNGFQIPFLPGKAGWHDIELTNSMFTVLGTGDWGTTINNIRILVDSTTGASGAVPIIHFDYLEVVKTGATVGGMLIRLDDGFTGQMDAASYAIGKGFPVHILVSGVRLDAGDTSYTTWDRLRELHDTGLVEIGIHYGDRGFPYDDRPTGDGIPDIQEKHQYLIQSKQNLIAQGYNMLTPDLISIPAGVQGSTSFGHPSWEDIQLMHEYSSVVIGTLPYPSGCDGTSVNHAGNNNSHIPFPGRARWYFPASPIASQTTDGGDWTTTLGYTTWKGLKDLAIANKDVWIYNEHNTSNTLTAPVWSITLDEWKLRMDEVASDVAAGNLRVYTYADLVL